MKFALFKEIRSPIFQQRRFLSPAQAATALRPFYFAVHPDLFGRYPEVRSTNENSLKLFNGYLDALYAAGAVKPVKVKFYLRHRLGSAGTASSAAAAAFKSVDVDLRHKDAYSTVKQVLETCRLPTEHLPPEAPDVAAKDDEFLRPFWRRTEARGGNELRRNVEKMLVKAEESRRTHAAFEKEVDIRIEQLKANYGLEAVLWTSGWTLNHCKGCLQLLNRVVDAYHVPRQSLRGWKIKFGRGIYVSVDGCLVLGVDDVPDDWCKLLRGVATKESYFDDVPRLERSLSELMLNARVQAWPDESVIKYKMWLRKMIGTFDTHAKTAPQSGTPILDLRHLAMVIVDESGSLSLDADGRVLLPASTPPEEFFRFAAENVEESREKKKRRKRQMDDLQQLRRKFVDVHGLREFGWDPLLNLESVNECSTRILDDSKLIDILRGHKIHVSTSYAVLLDGTISIPVDFH